MTVKQQSHVGQPNSVLDLNRDTSESRRVIESRGVILPRLEWDQKQTAL